MMMSESVSKTNFTQSCLFFLNWKFDTTAMTYHRLCYSQSLWLYKCFNDDVTQPSRDESIGVTMWSTIKGGYRIVTCGEVVNFKKQQKLKKTYRFSNEKTLLHKSYKIPQTDFICSVIQKIQQYPDTYYNCSKISSAKLLFLCVWLTIDY